MMLAPDAAGRWMPMPVTPGKQTEPGLIAYRSGADLFYANYNRCGDEVRTLVESTPIPVRWFIVDAGAITDIDYSAAQSLRDLLHSLARKRVRMVFARVSPYLRSDMDRHSITAAIGEARIFRDAPRSPRRGAPGGGTECLETYPMGENPGRADALAGPGHVLSYGPECKWQPAAPGRWRWHELAGARWSARTP
jgi:hypothetical protein